MDLGGSAVGVVSLGIQVCQGLLAYYGTWKDYKSDITATYAAIEDLSSTLVLLKGSLDNGQLDQERTERVQRCLHGCEEALIKLSEKSQKLQKYGQPQGVRQKAWAEFQRAFYPFRESTLVKLREIVNDIRERLKLAIQVLQLDTASTSQKTLADLSQRIAAIQAVQQSDQFRKIVAWLSPPDPWTNHASARQRHQAGTGDWLLQSNQYNRWKAGTSNHLWMSGKAGCGKTVLCSTVIEDIRAHCETNPNVWFAVFYFSFSDNQKQSYENLLRSLVAQLGWKEPGLTLLRQAYEKTSASTPATHELESILCSAIDAYEEVFVLLDALDECPETDDARHEVLERVERLGHSAPKLKILATSRELLDIRRSMKELGADEIAIATSAVDADIWTYVSSELSKDRRLARLNSDSKIAVEKTIAQKADGMFRWAYCQLHELKKLKSFRPSHVQNALRDLPATLDDTYARMLTGIDDMYRKDALKLLRWLAYARSPPTLGRLREAVVIDPVEDSVDFDDRGDIESTLRILSGLTITTIVTIKLDYWGREIDGFDTDGTDSEDNENAADGSNKGDNSDDGDLHHVNADTGVRLAHFSVKEYLESRRMLHSDAQEYHLDPAREHRVLAHSCLTYIEHYSDHCDRTSSKKDLDMFPLLGYAAKWWYHHSSLQQDRNASREVSFLTSEKSKHSWLCIHRPEDCINHTFGEAWNVGPPLFYASLLGLEAVVQALLDDGAIINAKGGLYGSALQAASYKGHEKMVATLLDRGADINAEGGQYGSALQAASYKGHKKVVVTLLKRGAHVNAKGGNCWTALQAASCRGSPELVRMLLGAGADVTAQGGRYGNALHAAAYEAANEKVVQLLLDAGADVNAQGERFNNVLCAAASGGELHSLVKVHSLVKLLVERGADVNGGALLDACYWGYEEIVQLLLDNGADVNLQVEGKDSALNIARVYGRDSIVALLKASGAVETPLSGSKDEWPDVEDSEDAEDAGDVEEAEDVDDP